MKSIVCSGFVSLALTRSYCCSSGFCLLLSGILVVKKKRRRKKWKEGKKGKSERKSKNLPVRPLSHLTQIHEALIFLNSPARRAIFTTSLKLVAYPQRLGRVSHLSCVASTLPSETAVHFYQDAEAPFENTVTAHTYHKGGTLRRLRLSSFLPKEAALQPKLSLAEGKKCSSTPSFSNSAHYAQLDVRVHVCLLVHNKARLQTFCRCSDFYHDGKRLTARHKPSLFSVWFGTSP